MEFMYVVRKTESKPCAYYLDGKRVCKAIYDYFMSQTLGKGCDSFCTTSTKTTWQYRCSGRVEAA
jgi:hypothetical protein